MRFTTFATAAVAAMFLCQESLAVDLARAAPAEESMLAQVGAEMNVSDAVKELRDVNL